MKKILCLATLFFLFAVQTAWAQMPKTIEGVAIDSKGVPLPDGIKNITFNIYDSLESKTPLWSEQQNVPIKDGRFSATLGSVNSFDLPLEKIYWLGMRVGNGKELSPRMKLTPGGDVDTSAGKAASLLIVSIEDADNDTKIQVEESPDEDKIRFDTAGSERMIIDDAGNVGIGTSSPNAPLQVANYLKFENGDPTSLSIGLNAGNVNAGAGNAFVGNSAGLNNTTGISNVAIGRAALQTNVSGARNMAIGTFALFANTASGNVAIGKKCYE